jgi:acetyl esterase/lipase
MELTIPGAPYAVRCTSVVYGAVPGLPRAEGSLALDLLLPEPRPASRVPAVAYLHGGAWRYGDRSAGMYPWNSPLLAAHGFVAVNVSYRLSDQAPFPAQAHDVKAAIRWLRANAVGYGIDPDRIGVWGDSAGGHLAALLATTAGVAELEGECGSPGESSAVQAAVVRCAPTDFTQRPDGSDPLAAGQDLLLIALFGGRLAERLELRRLASPAVFVHGGVPPMFVVHGTADEHVPIRQAERLVSGLRGHGVDVTFEVIEGGYHNLRPDPTPWTDQPWTSLGYQAVEFFTTHLGGRGSAG